METVRLGIIGLGCRGMSMINDVLCSMPGIKIAYICDVYQDRIDKCLEIYETEL